MGCESVEEYTSSLVHVSTNLDHAESMMLVKSQKYASITGTAVFRHVKTNRTAILAYKSENILVRPEQMVCVSKITNIQWQDTWQDTCALWFGTLEAKIRLKRLTYKEYTRDDRAHYAIPMSNLPVLNNDVKNQLQFLKCHLNINVNFNDETKCGTHRSMLIPKSLLSITPLVSHNGHWTIIACGNEPSAMRLIDASDKFRNFVGFEKDDDFKNVLDRCHTAAENKRIMHEIMPIIYALDIGSTYSYNSEFITDSGKHDIAITVYRLRSILIGVFAV